MLNDKKQTVLVAMNADAPRVVPGSIFTRHCDTCHSRLMIAPSGQAYLKQNPSAALMCYRCFCNGKEEWQDGGLAADPASIAEEIRSSVPNMRRRRN